jgi:hypothetical protein
VAAAFARVTVRRRDHPPINGEIVDALDEIQHELQALHQWFTGMPSLTENRQAQRHLNIRRWRSHLDNPPRNEYAIGGRPTPYRRAAVTLTSELAPLENSNRPESPIRP